MCKKVIHKDTLICFYVHRVSQGDREDFNSCVTGKLLGMGGLFSLYEGPL